MYSTLCGLHGSIQLPNKSRLVHNIYRGQKNAKEIQIYVLMILSSTASLVQQFIKEQQKASGLANGDSSRGVNLNKWNGGGGLGRRGRGAPAVAMATRP